MAKTRKDYEEWIPAAVGKMPVGTEATSRALDAIRAEEFSLMFALDDLPELADLVVETDGERDNAADDDRDVS